MEAAVAGSGKNAKRREQDARRPQTAAPRSQGRGNARRRIIPARPSGRRRARPRTDDTDITALDLAPAPLSPAMEAYFAKCEEKLGFVPNVLKAYAFDMAKLEAFVAMYNDLMLAPSGLSQARARDDRGRGVVAEPLLLLPGRARRRGAAAVGRSGARRADGDELSRRAARASASAPCSISR